jgi:hypothetical protein
MIFNNCPPVSTNFSSTLEKVWLKQPKIWFGQPNDLVDMALTKCVVETNQTVQPNVFGSYSTKIVWLESLTNLLNQTCLVDRKPNTFGWTYPYLYP